jgi:hypothetical protein
MTAVDQAWFDSNGDGRLTAADAHVDRAGGSLVIDYGSAVGAEDRTVALQGLTEIDLFLA